MCPESSPSRPQAVPDAVPIRLFRADTLRASPACPAPDRVIRWARRGAEPPAHVRGRAPGAAPRAGDPCRLHRCGALQYPRRQRAAGQPRPAPRGASPAHPVQLPSGGRFGRAEAQGLHPRRDRSAGRRGDARSALPLPHRAEGATGPPRRAPRQGESQDSTGRLDVFTRVITDNGDRFDEVAPGYHGALYLEVVPLSFPVRVREDLRSTSSASHRAPVAQRRGDPGDAPRGRPILYGRVRRSRRGSLLSNGLFLGLDLRGDERRQVGYTRATAAPARSGRAPRRTPSSSGIPSSGRTGG